METLNESLGRTPVPLVDSIVQINPQNSQSSKRLMVQLDLSKLDSSTLAALWNDSSVNWSKLSKPDLRKLYNALGKTTASFTEWMKANGFCFHIDFFNPWYFLFSLVAGMVPNNGIYYPYNLPLRGLNPENSKFLKNFSWNW